MARKKLVIIDGSSLIYRAFFALPPLTTADGTPTNAVYGYTTMLLKLLEEEKPDVLLVALEGGRTFRHATYADYKAQRPRTPDDLAVQTPLARAVTDAFRIPIIQHTGYEADDVIGTVTCRARDAGYEVLVVTGDLDALQLVNDHVKVLVNRRGITDAQLYDQKAVEERYGLKPSQLPDFKALKGDTSDNIPGIAGVGDKTATALISQYGSVENLMEHAEEVSAARVRTNLIEGREKAVLYKQLATIVTDLPLELKFDEWAYEGPDLPRARELFDRLEFRTLAGRLPAAARGGAPEPEVQPAAVPWRRVETDAELREWVERARATGVLAFRSLSTPVPGRGPVLRALALSAGGETVALAPAPDEDSSTLNAQGSPPSLFDFSEETWTPPPAILELVREVSTRGHDLKREMHALGEAPVRVGFDTLLAAYVLNPGRASYRLEDLTREHLRRGIPSSDPLEQLACQAAAIADLAEPMRTRLAEEELERVYADLELPLVPILAEMERVGVAVDCDELRGLSGRLAARIEALERQAHEAAGQPFNLGSPKQLQKVLFEDMNLPSGRKTKTGYSTDSDVLMDLAAQFPENRLPELILEWREMAKLKSTYADALQSLADPRDGRVHTHLNQAVAATGRLSSSDPNLQNIPIRTEVGREIRAAFVAAPGMKLLSADYSQIELRIMAHVCRDPELVRAFQEDRDVHAATAASVFSVPLEHVTADQRRSAKTVNFAVLYGQREFGLSRQLRIPTREARELIEAYFARFPGVLMYAQSTLSQARKWGFVCTLPPYCRKRYIPGIHAGNRNERMAAEREAVNAPIQGTAADIIKAAMIRIDRVLRERKLRSRMILQVHDELLFEIAPEEEAGMCGLVREEMESAFELSVPLRVEVKTGANWRDVEPGQGS
jgi:DNA polymerase-1